MLDGELPASEEALEGEVGDAHGGIMADRARPYAAGMSDGTTVVIVGSPTALGGHFAGMERAPAELRRRGLLERLVGAPRPRRDDVARPRRRNQRSGLGPGPRPADEEP